METKMNYEILAPGMVYYKNAISNTKEIIDCIEYMQEQVFKGVASNVDTWRPWNGFDPEKEKFCLKHTIVDPSKIHESDPLYKEIKFVYDNIFSGINQSFMHYSKEIYNHADRHIKSTEGMLSILKYSKSGYLPPHQDQGVSSRVLSTVAYLNDDYIGGEIYFPYVDIKLKPIAGSIIFFPSNFVYVHEVRSIEEGTRYSIPQWYHSLKTPRLSTGEA